MSDNVVPMVAVRDGATVHTDIPTVHSLSRTALVHNFIYDEEQIKRFAKLIDTENSYHVVCIVTRPKYNSVAAKNRHMLNTTFYGYTPEAYLDVIRRFELPIGAYKDKEKDSAYPIDCFVIYGTTNGRDCKKAVRKFVDYAVHGIFEESKDPKLFKHLQGKLDSCITSSKGKTKFLTMDIDKKEEYYDVKNFLDEYKVKPAAVIETHGGYHVLLHTSDLDIFKGSLHKRFGDLHTMGDTSCAIPGTLQAGFPVRFIDDN